MGVNIAPLRVEFEQFIKRIKVFSVTGLSIRASLKVRDIEDQIIYTNFKRIAPEGIVLRKGQASENRPRLLFRFRGNVLSFVVQYETRLEGNWLPVVRYDTEHGFAHRDLFDSKGNKSKTPMFTDDYNKALTFTEYDIKLNWTIYKKAFMGGAEYEEDTG